MKTSTFYLIQAGDILLHTVKEQVDKYNLFQEARRAANAAGKPLLNVGCKNTQPYASLSDVNLDLVPRDVPNFVLGDAQDLSMFGDKEFGAAFVSHTLEHLKDPDRALSELDRVADSVFVLGPSALNILNWIYPGHEYVSLGPWRVKIDSKLNMRLWLLGNMAKAFL